MQMLSKGVSFFQLTVLCFVLPYSVNLAQSKLLDKVINKFNSEKSIAVDVIQDGSATKGKMFFEAPDKEKIILNESEIIVVADTVWNYNTKLSRLVIQERSEEFSPFSLLDILYKLPAKCSYSENIAENKFILKPIDQQELNFRSVSIVIGKNKLPRKIFLIDINGNKYSFSLKKYILGEKYGDSFFKVKSKKGIKIVDLR